MQLVGLGAGRLLVTNSYDVVWLKITRGWIALSPERPADFVARLRPRLAAATTMR